MDVEATIDAIIRELAGVADDDRTFNRQVHLFDSGYLDSLLAIHVLTRIECDFSVHFDDTEKAAIRAPNIEALAQIVRQKLAEGPRNADG